MRLFILCAASAFGVGTAVSQPVIDASSLQNLAGKSFQSTVNNVLPSSFPDVLAIYNSTGGGQTYDFTPLNYGGPTVINSEARTSISGTPGEDYAGASASNFVLINFDLSGLATSYSFYTLDNAAYRLTAIALIGDLDTDGKDDTTWTTYDPPRTFMQFPLTAGTEWAESATVTTQSVFGTSSVVQEIQGEVDGWGDLVLPGAVSLPAVRLRTTITQGTGVGAFTFEIVQLVPGADYNAFLTTDLTGNIQSANYTVIQTTNVAIEDVRTSGFSLGGNFPNPLSHATTIPFEVESPGIVRLAIVDLLGREVGLLVDGFVAAGHHRATLDAADLASGLYVYRLDTRHGTSARQMVVVR